MYSRYIHFFVISLLIAGCSERRTATLEPVEPQYDYFPLELNRYVDYAVDSTVYDFAVGGATVISDTSFYLRELVADTLRDGQGNLVYKVERYVRPDLNASWVFDRAWTAIRTENAAIRTEENLRFLRLIFPFNSRSAWNGNRYIDELYEIQIAGERMRPYGNWNYEVDSLDLPETIGSFAFDSVLTVTEVDESNAIEYRYSRAKYAKGVGLVWREQWILDSQYCNQTPIPADCLLRPWREKAEKGYILRMLVIGYN